MNILMLTQDFPPVNGGIAIFVQHICQELQRNNVHVKVLAQDAEGAATFDNAQSYAIYRYGIYGRLTSMSPILSTVLRSLFGRINILFLGHMLSTHGLGAWLCWKILRVPYVILVHGFDLVEYLRQSRLDRFVSNIILKNAALIFANSEYTKTLIPKRIRDKIKVIVAKPGVDANVFKPGVDTSEIRQRYNISNERIILTVSRLVPKKNHEQVLKALPEVIQKTPNLKYIIVGEGPEKARLETLTERLGIKNRVIFAGFVEHSALPQYYCLCDIFIMPSCITNGNFESFGIVFAEASACGKPVIGSKTAGISDVVVDGVTGILVEPDDTTNIAKALSRLLTDEQLALNIGKNGRERVANKLTWQVMGERIMTSLNCLLSSGKI